MIVNRIHNLTVSSWNIQGLGDKCKDESFLSFLKYDINIVLETWKGTEPDFCIQHFYIIQKCRKKKKRSNRFSGGVMIIYKSNLHKGITEVKNLTRNENRIWIKLDRNHFGFQKDLYICACYVPPVSSGYYDEDFSKIENEISNVMSRNMCNILVMGDLNARISNRADFIINENRDNEPLDRLLPDNYNIDYNIHRYSVDKVFNSQGQNLLDLCIASQVRVLNGRFIGDSIGNFTCYKPNSASTVDYALADVDLINNIIFFKVSEPTYLSDHAQIAVHIKCDIIENNHKYDEYS